MDERERREKLEKLASLDKIYIDVMYYRLLGKDVPDIAETLKIPNTKTVYTRFTRIFERLDIQGDNKEDQLIREYSPIFFEFIKSEKDLANWGIIRAEIIRQAKALESQPAPVAEIETHDSVPVEASDSETEEVPTSSTSTPEQTSAHELAVGQAARPVNRPPVPPWVPIGVGILVFCLLCGSGLLFVIRNAPDWFEQDATPTGISETGIPGDPTRLVPTNTSPVLPSATSQPTSTDTAIPATPTVPSPTLALTPTLTAQPTETITPLPPALFEADFESGFPAGMEYVRENLDIVNGELIAHEYTLLGFGDETWKNYEVEYEARKHTYCWGVQNNGIAAHAVDQENMIMWSWNYCETGWFEILNGDWIKINGGRDIIANPGTVVKIRLVAENGNFTVYVNNNKNSSYFNEKYMQGKAYILVTDSSVIDNIRISQLP